MKPIKSLQNVHLKAINENTNFTFWGCKIGVINVNY